jgi:hypothetical protein
VAGSWDLGDGGAPVRIGDPSQDEFEIGDAVREPTGTAVGVIHRTAAGRTAAIAWIAQDTRGSANLFDLGPTLGDGPPPRLMRGPNGLFAAAYGAARVSVRADEARDLILYTVPLRAPPTVRESIRQQRDDSLAFDVAASGASMLAVWDEATTGARGVIRCATIQGDAGATRDLSPPESDAEAPRIIASAGGFTALWLARQSEVALDDARSSLAAEAPGEPRAFGWIESIRVDGRGVALGQVRRLTSMNGHVSAYDAQALDDASVLVVARDDGESMDGSGGTLLRVRMAGDRVDPPLAFSMDGLGRGAPMLVDGSPLWLSWVGPHEQLRLIPLDAIGAPAGPLSAEESLNDARPLLVLSAPPGAPERVLVATPLRPEAQLRTFACAR